ncbi:MAG: PIN domain-containing protein [Nitrospirae bacterium]|nr:PIN domain-containing protein [Nitrospirota bacterium]
MTGGNVFVDTHIIVYAYDVSAGKKHDMAVELMEDLWSSGRGVISTQVLQELFVTITKKLGKPLDIVTAKEIVKDLLKWKTIIVDGDIILEAIDSQKEYGYSFWDSVIIASALEGGAATLLSEDLSDRRQVKGITIRNPFIAG